MNFTAARKIPEKSLQGSHSGLYEKP